MRKEFRFVSEFYRICAQRRAPSTHCIIQKKACSRTRNYYVCEMECIGLHWFVIFHTDDQAIMAVAVYVSTADAQTDIYTICLLLLFISEFFWKKICVFVLLVRYSLSNSDISRFNMVSFQFHFQCSISEFFQVAFRLFSIQVSKLIFFLLLSFLRYVYVSSFVQRAAKSRCFFSNHFLHWFCKLFSFRKQQPTVNSKYHLLCFALDLLFVLCC